MSDYLKRFTAPRSWTILRKEYTYITKPTPGAHAIEDGMPLSVFLKILGQASTTSEAKRICDTTKVLVDGKRVKDHRFALGLMDVLSLADGSHHRIVLDAKGRLVMKVIDAKHVASKPCRVLGKHVINGGKLQLTLSGGRAIITDKKDVKVGDTVVIALPKQSITHVLALKKGAKILLTGGKHIGTVGTVDSIQDGLVRYEHHGKHEQTRKDYAFVVPEGVLG